MKSIYTLILSLTICTSIPLAAIDLGTEINLSGGYRNDKLVRKNITALTPSFASSTDNIEIKNLSIGQIGLNGRLMLPTPDSCYETTVWNNFFIEGYGYWGWGGHGSKLHEYYTDLSTGFVEAARANLRGVRTNDYQIGLGYLFDMDCWAIGISAGYAYDRQKIKTKNGQISFPYPLAPFIDVALFDNGYKTTTTWSGPWVGTELYYQWGCDWLFGLGYEYHFTDYHANHTIPNTPEALLEGIATKTKGSNASGNVGFLKARYKFCEGWDVGASFKYVNYTAKKAHAHITSLNAADFPDTIKIKAKGQWISYSVNLDIGFAF